MADRARTLVALGRFVALSGCGWLLDLCILVALSRLADWPLFAANVASSITAASVVFLLSRAHIFNAAEGGLPVRLSAYVAYTLALIVVASSALQLLAPGVRNVLAMVAPGFENETMVTTLAKVIVTPPQLALNFLMSRFLSERALPRSRNV